MNYQTTKNEINLIELFRIPNFIDCSSLSDVNCWRATRSIIDLYYIMAITNRILEEESLITICKKMDYYTEELVSMQEERSFLYANIITERVEYIQDVLIENELWEGMENIRKFEELEL